LQNAGLLNHKRAKAFPATGPRHLNLDVLFALERQDRPRFDVVGFVKHDGAPVASGK